MTQEPTKEQLQQAISTLESRLQMAIQQRNEATDNALLVRIELGKSQNEVATLKAQIEKAARSEPELDLAPAAKSNGHEASATVN